MECVRDDEPPQIADVDLEVHSPPPHPLSTPPSHHLPAAASFKVVVGGAHVATLVLASVVARPGETVTGVLHFVADGPLCMQVLRARPRTALPQSRLRVAAPFTRGCDCWVNVNFLFSIVPQCVTLRLGGDTCYVCPCWLLHTVAHFALHSHPFLSVQPCRAAASACSHHAACRTACPSRCVPVWSATSSTLWRLVRSASPAMVRPAPPRHGWWWRLSGTSPPTPPRRYMFVNLTRTAQAGFRLSS